MFDHLTNSTEVILEQCVITTGEITLPRYKFVSAHKYITNILQTRYENEV